MVRRRRFQFKDALVDCSMTVRAFRAVGVKACPRISILSPSVVQAMARVKIIKKSEASARIGTLCRVISQSRPRVSYAVKSEASARCAVSYKTIRYINSYKIVKYLDSEPNNKAENEMMKIVECIDVIAETAS